MQILKVTGKLTCTSRVDGLKYTYFTILSDKNGKMQVATDPVGSKLGNWVFCASGSAARFATGDAEILTDLTVSGIIDGWEEEESFQ